jgi:hypothetical protein
VTIPSVDSIEVREAYVEIVRLPDYHLVTSLELLSPWNKFGLALAVGRHQFELEPSAAQVRVRGHRVAVLHRRRPRSRRAGGKVGRERGRRHHRR